MFALRPRASGDLAGLRGEVDRGLRTRRFLGYRESSQWARAAQPIVDELRLAVERAPSRDLVVLLERAVGHVVKVIGRADDSNGTIGDLGRELLDLHAQVCDAERRRSGQARRLDGALQLPRPGLL